MLNDPTGPLYENRNRPTGEDQRRQGLYDPTASIHVEAKDDLAAADNATTRAGTKNISLLVDKNHDGDYLDSGESVETQQNSGCTTTQCPNKQTFEYALDLASFPGDGDYKVKVIARDLADNHRDLKEWMVTVDRAGDIYSAREFDLSASATAGQEPIATEDFQRSSWNARRTDDGLITTREAVPCTSDASRSCGEVRRREEIGEGANPSIVYSRRKGATEDDSRLESVSQIQAARRGLSGIPAQQSSLTDALEVWQTPPPAHGNTAERYDSNTQVNVDGQDTTQVTQVWVDAATRLPLRVRRATGSELDYEAFYTYNRSRRTPAEAPGDLFRVAAPPAGPDEEIDYSADPTPTPEPDPVDPTVDERVQEIAGQRRLFGLNDSEALIRATMQEAGLDASIDEIGFPLRSDELALIRRRDTTAEAGEQAQAAEGSRNPSEYAGMYMDYTTGDGLVYVGYTANVDANLAAFRATFPYPDRVRGYQAQRSLASLTALRDRVRADVATLESQNIDLTSISIEPEQNKVALGVNGLTPSKTSTLEASYGTGISTKAQDPAIQTASRVYGSFGSTPGGIRIARNIKGSDDEVGCSSGFSARGTGRYSRRRYVLTSGHCGYPGGPEFTRDRDGLIVGTVSQRLYGGQVDAALISANSGEASNKILFDASRGTLRFKKITRYARPRDNFFELKKRCFVGYRQSYDRCGIVGSPDDVKYCDESGGNCQRVENQSTLATSERNGAFTGDSGGPVFRDDIAFGIVSGSSRDHRIMYYTPIGRALDAFTVDLYTR